jgi:hypothetical protein
MAKQTIELDCAPFTPRPDTVLKDVLEDTGIPSDREPVSMVFGCWTWDYSDIPEATWNEKVGIIKERILEAYGAGRIRYGSW